MKLTELRASFPPSIPFSDSVVILSKISGISKASLLADYDMDLDEAKQNHLKQALSDYVIGKPLPYIIGEWEFYGLSFIVNPDVLIPRPETELIIDEVLNWISRTKPAELNIIDIGTGSGIIPITLAKKHPQANVWACDISEQALKVAKSNAVRHKVDNRIKFKNMDLFQSDQLGQKTFTILTANLPYIPTKTLTKLDIYGKEPTLALDGGQDGLDLIRKLIQQIASAQMSIKLILLEIEYSQGEAVQKFAREAFGQTSISIVKDLSGNDRLLKIEIFT
jgi:release factor glutamine methyltransferase